MARIFIYIGLVLAPLLVLLAIALAIGVALFDLSVFRSDVFALFAIGFVAFALATSVTVGVLLARAAKPPPRPEPPSV
jgi:hypothetical protein